MAVTAWRGSGTCVDDASVGTITWVADDFLNALVGTEVSADDGVYAGVFSSTVSQTHYLKCTNLGFTSSDVPTGSTIDGFEIEVRQYRTSIPAVTSTVMRFVKGGTISGNDIGVSADWPTPTETAVTYGSSVQLGGLSWTQSDVVASNFGIAFYLNFGSSRLAPSGRNVFVDQVRIRIYYTPAGPPTIAGISSITGMGSITW